MYIAQSVDGDVIFTMDQLRAGVGTAWNDTNYINVWTSATPGKPGSGEFVGLIDPKTGVFHEFPEGRNEIII